MAIGKQLLAQGHEVVSFSRGHHPELSELGVSHVQGSLSDFLELRQAMEGCEAVFHVAAKTGQWGSFESFYEANVVGTMHVIRACRSLGIRYLVFTSSPSVVYDGGFEGKDESLPYPEKFDAHYPETKAYAEQAILKANSPELITCSLRPHLVWGPGDPHYLPRLMERRRKNQLRILGHERNLVDTIYIDNAAKAHLQAFQAMLNQPELVAGKAYFLSQDEPIPISEFMNRLLACGGLPPVDRYIDPKLALALGHVLQGIYRFFRIKAEPRVTPFIAKQLSSSHWYDISAAKRNFGYVPTVSIDEGMRRLKEWVGNGLK